MDLLIIMLSVGAFCGALCLIGLLVSVIERIPMLAKSFEKFAGWLLK